MRTLLLLAFPLIMSGCSVSHYVNREIKKSEILSQQHTGVSILTEKGGKNLAAYNDDKYFIPASNTKIYSLYAGLNALGDSIPGLEYLEWGELLLIRGTGDPSLMHPDLPKSKVIDFLKSRKEQIFYTSVHFEDERFGPGWAWDDYNGYYQPEVSAMPIYGNIARFSRKQEREFSVYPGYWKRFTKKDTTTTGFLRDEESNYFHYSQTSVDKPFKQDVPVRMSDDLLVEMLSDVLKKEVKSIRIPLNIELQKVYSIPSDSLYRRMMYESDNLLAEQLMLLYASANGMPLNTTVAIEHATANHFKGIPDKPVWKDGSGMSRYNLFTPRSTTWLLQQIDTKLPKERLYAIFPAGGVSGTVKNQFKADKPFVYAKTGGMSNVYNLSGYLLTKKGKTLIFSFMNNNFVRPASEVKAEVERILTAIHNRF
ncbi:D-alanyl-D-alanine carboxypeptidase/D-alanyl-D-alanine-endopeptidase [Dyadobacter luteus]|uniref:D-alanyl-D-alanine carboxypeptidase/D-alanyl-D-alanine-endopeptidase n=1 Tax=Dyadobacter luteus TaxID=2259619 RepID=A0A3D8Y2G7_9BACT|nr:D-alanyl-D-alanine carboxypeptidase [Dyadobacter luteus]REA55268.1 D-alanyl-D-alanine carboxypeptidase/D-alanyl-D-alanine-endopeptidase [Dyadobacter luteus]